VSKGGNVETTGRDNIRNESHQGADALLQTRRFEVG
jgi:hypothetical protein